jgi:hypothetical protein
LIVPQQAMELVKSILNPIILCAIELGSFLYFSHCADESPVKAFERGVVPNIEDHGYYGLHTKRVFELSREITEAFNSKNFVIVSGEVYYSYPSTHLAWCWKNYYDHTGFEARYNPTNSYIIINN